VGLIVGMRRFVLLLLRLSLFSFCLLWSGVAEGATLAGQTIRPGATLDIRFPIDKDCQNYAAAGGNPRPTTGRAVITFPKNFDPARRWPILVVTSTTDANRTSPMDAPMYEDPATAEGWIVLASDATIRPRLDSTTWRLGILVAALQTIRKEWPQARQWPVAFAGFSGGAKSSGVLGVMLAKSGVVNVCGFFLAGINDDRLGQAYKEFHPPPDFLKTPIWLSSGMNDRTASPGKHEYVKSSLEHNGFQRVHLESFFGGHEVNPAQVQLALRWFREVGKF
jgi:hypothetical protein